MKKAVFIDRDGVIIEERNYAYKVEDLAFIPGSIDALKALAKTDYVIIIVTNQAGIARGYFTEKDYNAFTAHMLRLLKDAGARVDGVYFCPHHPAEGVGKYRVDCDCRKPKTGMIDSAAGDFGIELGSSWFIGDKSSDILAGKSAGCRAVLVKTGYGGKDAGNGTEPDYVTDDLNSAVRLILDKSAQGCF
ncbi:D-glycero-beta-D-manno-heptose 1,7-bisphosphate 7-phosphatase [bacterium]|nr:MAG: D-glycero-beta-D-manno-heptose 1,7-bisphosphate 7-phosphatase [bacterium]